MAKTRRESQAKAREDVLDADSIEWEAQWELRRRPPVRPDVSGQEYLGHLAERSDLPPEIREALIAKGYLSQSHSSIQVPASGAPTPKRRVKTARRKAPPHKP
jgi:hypothetical protein